MARDRMEELALPIRRPAPARMSMSRPLPISRACRWGSPRRTSPLRRHAAQPSLWPASAAGYFHARGAIPPARWVDPIARFEVLGAMDSTRIEPVDTTEEVVLKMIAGLSASECRVLVALVRGRTTPEIAKDVSLAPKPVRNYISNIIGKLGVTSRAEAVARVTRGH